MEKTINEILIKVSGKSPIAGKGLTLGSDITVTIKGGIVKKEIFDNQDNTVNICYVVKPIETLLVTTHEKD